MILSTENAMSLNPPNFATQISRYFAVQIQMQILAGFEFVPRNLSFWNWRISGVQYFEWKL